MKYFENIETLEELKKAYKKVVFMLHPDRNKDRDTTKEFQEMQNEYDKKFNEVKDYKRNKDGVKYYKASSENVNLFKNIIDKIIHFENVNIELIGEWLWISGETKSYAEILKELKFRWSANKLAWYYHEGSYKKASKKKLNMQDLRNLWGNQEIENDPYVKLEA